MNPYTFRSLLLGFTILTSSTVTNSMEGFYQDSSKKFNSNSSTSSNTYKEIKRFSNIDTFELRATTGKILIEQTESDYALLSSSAPDYNRSRY